jgi:hypothetical protein
MERGESREETTTTGDLERRGTSDLQLPPTETETPQRPRAQFNPTTNDLSAD